MVYNRTVTRVVLKLLTGDKSNGKSTYRTVTRVVLKHKWWQMDCRGCNYRTVTRVVLKLITAF